MASSKRDMNYGLALGKAVRLGDLNEIIEWVSGKCGEIQSFVQSGGSLINTALPKALGPPGKPGNVEEIVYVAKRLAEVYLRIIEWTIEFGCIQVDDEFSHLMELISRMSHNAIEEIEKFAIDYKQGIDDAMRQYEESKQPQSFEVTCTLTCPDMTELNGEIRRLMGQMGSQS
jgi:hypothetical protein